MSKQAAMEALNTAIEHCKKLPEGLPREIISTCVLAAHREVVSIVENKRPNRKPAAKAKAPAGPKEGDR